MTVQVVNEGSGAYIKRTVPLRPVAPKVRPSIDIRIRRWLREMGSDDSRAPHTHRLDRRNGQ